MTQYPEMSLSSFKNNSQTRPTTIELESCWNECRAIVSASKFKNYFAPDSYDKYYNEVPIQFKDKDQMVYGLIDRLIIKDSTATIIDYKTHPYATSENIADIAQSYKQQMQLYQNGIKLLWPAYTVKVVLLFTAVAEEYHCN